MQRNDMLYEYLVTSLRVPVLPPFSPSPVHLFSRHHPTSLTCPFLPLNLSPFGYPVNLYHTLSTGNPIITFLYLPHVSPALSFLWLSAPFKSLAHSQTKFPFFPLSRFFLPSALFKFPFLPFCCYLSLPPTPSRSAPSSAAFPAITHTPFSLAPFFSFPHFPFSVFVSLSHFFSPSFLPSVNYLQCTRKWRTSASAFHSFLHIHTLTGKRLKYIHSNNQQA